MMQVLTNVALAKWHTLAAEATADNLLILEHEAELRCLEAADMILGGGSNIVFASDISRRLVKLDFQEITLLADKQNKVSVAAGAGVSWHQFVEQMVAQGFVGLENLALIPGTVGAAPVQNIGAYGVEVAARIERIKIYDRKQGGFKWLLPQDCGFAYRYSHFKGKWRERYVIVTVVFALSKHNDLCLNYKELRDYMPELTSARAVFAAVCAIRREKLPNPDTLPNAGSFFHNPIVSLAHYQRLQAEYPDIPAYVLTDGQVKIPAAWLIERCGLKGYREDNVGIYAHHALVLVHYGGETGKAILTFAGKVQKKVRQQFEIALQIEPTIIGGVA